MASGGHAMFEDDNEGAASAGLLQEKCEEISLQTWKFADQDGSSSGGHGHLTCGDFDWQDNQGLPNRNRDSRMQAIENLELTNEYGKFFTYERWKHGSNLKRPLFFLGSQASNISDR